MQGRLIPEMRLANITTKTHANKFLHENFIPNQYNKNFMVAPSTNEISYKTNFRKNLNEVFSKKDYRVIKADQSFSYNTTRYVIDTYPGNLSNKIVQIRTYQDREIKFFWAERELSVSTFSKMAA